MALNKIEVVVDDDGGVTVSPSAVARLGARPGEHLQLVRGRTDGKSRPKKVGGILEGKVAAADLLTSEDFAAAKAQRIGDVEHRFGPLE